MPASLAGRKLRLAFGLLLAAAVCASASEGPAAVPAPAAAVKAGMWARDIALVYLVPSGNYGPQFWNAGTLKSLVAYTDPDGKARDWLFDGFLFFGPMTKSGANMTGAPSMQPATAADGDWALNSWLEGAAQLSDALQQAAKEMNVAPHELKVVLCVPYPDNRCAKFGPIAGETLDLSKDENRVRAANLFTDMALRGWDEYAAKGRLKGLKLVGFYWTREGIWKDFPSKVNNDPEVVKEWTAYVHSKGLLVHWIPGLGCQTPDSKRIGLDCVTVQVNYQAPPEPNSPPRPLSLFDDVNAIVEKFGMNGTEFNTVIRTHELNPRLYSAYQVWLANFDAALRLNWARFSAVTYFNTGEITPVAADPTHRIYYDKLYKWIKRTLTEQDNQELAAVLARELAAKGFLDAERLKKISEAKTVLEKLHLMERPEADWKNAPK